MNFYFYQVDPFLKLVEDCKLQVVNLGQDNPKQVYGSKEDNENAAKSLSAVDQSESQSKKSFANLILQTCENMSEVSIISVYHKVDRQFLFLVNITNLCDL